MAEALVWGHLGGAGIDVFERRAADRFAAARGAEHAADAASRRLDGRGPGTVAEEVAAQVLDVLDGRSAAVRGQRPAVDARDRPGDRPVPAAGRDPRAVLRPVLARRRPDADPGDRRRAGRARRLAARRRRSCAACSRRPRPSGSTWSTPARWPRPAASPSIERKTPDAGAYARSSRCRRTTGGRPVTVGGTVAGGEPRHHPARRLPPGHGAGRGHARSPATRTSRAWSGGSGACSARPT